MKIAFIHNPHAGTSRTEVTALLRSFAQNRAHPVSLHATKARGHATELAHAAVAAGCDVVVAVGGDGTTNEVGRALVGTGAALGLVPRGSGNGLARQLGIPLDPAGALATIAGGRVRTIDTGVANDHVFLCAMGLGFDAAVIRRFESLPRRGFTAYLGAALLEWLHHRPETVIIAAAGEAALERRCLLVAVANAAQFGNGAMIAPLARPDDGALDLVAVSATNPFSALRLVVRLFRGTLHRSRQVVTRRGGQFTITRECAGPVHVDGELIETTAQVEVQVRPGSLRVVAP